MSEIAGSGCFDIIIYYSKVVLQPFLKGLIELIVK